MGTDLEALAKIQGRVIEMRQMAAKTKNPRERDACLRVADWIEKQARVRDRSGRMDE
jgi:hypothetical protein